jgi:nucleoside-triphosphatase THEP1
LPFPVPEKFEISANRACLRDLQTTNPRHDKYRIETDKGGLLKDAYSWILDHADFKRWRYEQESQLLWIKGDPGKGKTMLLCGIIDELTKSALDTTTISFFFCQASDERINRATAVLRGLIFMLVDQQPSLLSHIRRQYDKTGKQVFVDVNAWEALSEILTSILEDQQLQTTYLVIDAVDECTIGRARLLELVAQKSSAYPHVKWIVSSRNWPAIEETLDAATRKTKLCLELSETSVAEAVATYIDYKVQKLTEKKKYNEEIRHAVFQHLLSNAHGTFLWVALVCEKLAHVPKRNVRKRLEEFPSGLDKLYERMLDQISESDDAEFCKSLLSIIMTVYRPITLDELTSCIDLSEKNADDSDLAEIISLCGSFLTLRGRTISLVHQSAKDSLLQEAVHQIFPDGEDRVHYSIFSKLLGAITRTLRHDIYNLVHPGYSIDQVNQPDPDPLAAMRYACVYWVDHLNGSCPNKNAIEDLQDSGSVGIFFHNNYLHWLEALSLSRSLSEGVASMLKLESLLKVCFHQYNRGTILTLLF